MAEYTNGRLLTSGLLAQRSGASPGLGPNTAFGIFSRTPFTTNGVQRWDGAYKIEGTTVKNGAALPGAAVWVIPRGTHTIVAGGNSAADGTYSFKGLAAGEYLVIGFDRFGGANALIYDHVTAVAM